MRAKQLRQGLLIGVLLVVSFWLTTSIVSLAGKALVAVSEAREAQAKFEQLEARKTVLTANLATFGTERGNDAAIRTSFGVARPGEEVIVVVPLAPSTPVVPKTWWQKIVSWF